MLKKRCKLCNRTYSYSYQLFGRGCFNTECNLLNIEIPKNEKNKEKYFCDEIAKKLNKYGISQNKKYNLVEKYLTLEYLNKIKYGDLSKEKQQIQMEIENILFSKSIKKTMDKLIDSNVINGLRIITLNKVYRLYKTTLKFRQKIELFEKELRKANTDKNKELIIEKYLLEELKFVFDSSKIANPVYYQVYYAMQVIAWKIVISGGLIKKYYLSSELLQKFWWSYVGKKISLVFKFEF